MKDKVFVNTQHNNSFGNHQNTSVFFPGVRQRVPFIEAETRTVRYTVLPQLLFGILMDTSTHGFTFQSEHVRQRDSAYFSRSGELCLSLQTCTNEAQREGKTSVHLPGVLRYPPISFLSLRTWIKYPRPSHLPPPPHTHTHTKGWPDLESWGSACVCVCCLCGNTAHTS